MPVMLNPQVRALCTESKNFACLVTMMPDDTPHTTVVWVDADDQHVLVNTELGRRQADNALRDPRVAVMIWDVTNPYRYVEVRGRITATITGPQARAHIDYLSHKYVGRPYASPIRTERVILEISPEHQFGRRSLG